MNKQRFHLAALCSLVALPTAWADGGNSGNTAITVEVINNNEYPIVVIGEEDYGKPGYLGNYQTNNATSGKSISSVNFLIENKVLKGYQGNIGENALVNDIGLYGAGGNGGAGGGTIAAGVSIGGAGGGNGTGISFGGDGGAISNSLVRINELEIIGGNGGDGGDGKGMTARYSGGGGAGGIGGGSVLGGISIGGSGGESDVYFPLFFPDSNPRVEVFDTDQKGGEGGDVFNNTISMSYAKLQGGDGGDGGSGNSILSSQWGIGGLGGGSVIGGLSIGGAGGYGDSFTLIFNNGVNPDKNTISSLSNGGDGGDIYKNSIELNNVSLKGGTAGINGNGVRNPLNGGSVFGGVSIGGSGGIANLSTNGIKLMSDINANGGDGGNVDFNSIEISGKSDFEGSIYGGYSKGGAAGQISEDGVVRLSKAGSGKLTRFNTITLNGDSINIGGSIYGGLSINGDDSENFDAEYIKYYEGNTLNIRNGRIDVQGVKNFENYNWLLPQNAFKDDVIITIVPGGSPVEMANTIHRVDVDAVGNTLHAGDKVYLINNVNGNFDRLKSSKYLEQGFFIVYDATLDVEKRTDPNSGVTSDALTLTVLGTNDDVPDGKNNPESEEFLKGRVAQLAMVDQGADMMSDGIWSARASLREKNANLFTVVDGGSNSYKTSNNSHIKLNDIKFAVGAAKAATMNDQSVGMVGVFAEHGTGHYNSYSDFGSSGFGEVRANGKTRYHGVGALFHVDVANTDLSKVKNKPNIFDDKYGLYLHGVLRAGHVKVDFHSADLVNGKGVEGSYNTKSRYVTAMAGAGYVLTLDEKKAVDFYGRYTFSRVNGKDVQVVDEPMSAGTAHSHRLRLGARLGYAYSEKATPYAGLAYERNFNGDVSGSAYGFTIKEKSLKGNTGIVEAGLLVKPKGANDPFSLNLGLQGYLGDRKGLTAVVRARYVF